MGSALDSFPSGSYQTGVASVPPVYEKEGTGERRKVTGFLTLLCSEQPCCLLQFFSGLSFLLKQREAETAQPGFLPETPSCRTLLLLFYKAPFPSRPH